MVTKTELCSYTENKIYPGRGRRHIGRDGKTYFFISTKARSLFHQKIKPVKLTWTQAWRRFNKKIRVDELNKKRSRKATRVQKAVVGMSLDEIKRRKAETREDRDKKHEVAIKEIKERKVKEMQAKKIEKAKIAKVAAPSKAVSKQNAAPKAKVATAARGKK
jgi:large subunit ribosomal protein L24e